MTQYRPSRRKHPKARAGLRLPPIRLVVFVAVCLGLLGLHLGCSDEVRKYETLSFFFDGVPVPESLRDRYPQAVTEDEDLTVLDRVAINQANRPKPIEFIYHHPYANRNCFTCHDRDGGYQLIVAGPELCLRCHPSHVNRGVGDWMHGPVILGECRRCHEPHKSEVAGLLTSAQPQLCLKCHDVDFINRDPFHSQLEDLTCSNCHDPHSAGNRKLLADARTYQRNRAAAERLGSDHPSWGPNKCSMCHQVDASMVLVENIDQVCQTCHEDQTKNDTGQAIHDPVAKGKCTTCHTPHDSPRPHLVRPLAEQMCISCHPLKKVNTPAHPKVTRVDCLQCHNGHFARREHMLRPGIGQPLLDEPVKRPEPTEDTSALEPEAPKATPEPEAGL